MTSQEMVELLFIQINLKDIYLQKKKKIINLLVKYIYRDTMLKISRL